jgi:hypothetical protein
MKVKKTTRRVNYQVALSEVAKGQKYGDDVEKTVKRPPRPEMRDEAIEADERRRYLKDGEGNLCITVAPGEELGELHVSLQFEGPKGQHNPCMADQNELLVEGSEWLKKLLIELYGEKAELEVEIAGNPCPKAELPLQIELAAEVLQGRIQIEQAIRQCREVKETVLGKVKVKAGVAQESRLARKITSEP